MVIIIPDTNSSNNFYDVELNVDVALPASISTPETEGQRDRLIR